MALTLQRRRREKASVRRRGRILVACVREHDWSQPVAISPIPRSCDELVALVEHARFHGVEACLYLSLRGIDGLDPDGSAYLESAYFTALQWHLTALRALAEVRAVLDAAHVRWLVVKGPALAQATYRRSDLRSYGDLDIVVSADDFGRAVDAFERHGSEILESDWQSMREEMPGQVHLRLDSGSLIDLHWNLINQRYGRSVFPIRTSELFDRSRSVLVGEERCRTLGEADTLVFLALHACRHGGNRLLWLKDLEQAMLSSTLQWSEVVERAHEWHASLAVATMLIRTRRALAVTIPSDVIESLAPRSWRTVIDATERLSPVERSTGHTTLALLVNHSVRADERSSLRNLQKRTWRLVRALRAREVHLPAAPQHGLRESIGLSADDASKREQYFEAVAMQERFG